MKRRSVALSPRAKNILAALVAAGGLVLVIAALLAPVRAWTAYLTTAFYFLSIALGGLVVTALLNVAKAGWGVVIKRVPEGVTGYLPWGAASMLVVLLGAKTLYPWTGPEAHEDPVLLAKASYLNLPAFAARMVIVLGLWLLFARLLRRASVAQDTDKAIRHTTRSVALSAGFLLVFALSFSVASFDWLMSLSPHWQSTIFAWYDMAGVVVSGLAVTLVVSIHLRRTGALAEVNPSHLHDLAKLLFAMCTFWAYLWVSQYLLVWYANMPEETVYYVTRTQGGYRFLFWANLVINWLVPFVALLPRAAKRSESHILRVCVVVLLGRWLDVYLQVAPQASPEHAGIGWIELASVVSFGAAFVLIVERSLRRAPLIAAGDPYLVESLHHAQ